MGLARAYQAQKRWEIAAQEWEKVLALDPEHTLARDKIKKAKDALNEEEEADQNLSESQKKRQMQIYFLLGSEHYKNGEYEEAIKSWKEVLALDPNHKLSQEKIKRAEEKLEDR